MQSGNSIITIIVLVLASIFAIFLGTSIGTEDQQTPILVFTSIAVLGVMFRMGRNLWILLLIFFPLAGRISVLPFPLSVSNLAVLFVFAAALLMIPLGGFTFRGHFTLVEGLLLIVLADIGLIFLMNPVGLSSLGSDTVGSRPYFEIALAATAYLVLRNQALKPKQVGSVVGAIVITMALISLGKIVSRYAPGAGYSLWMIYSDFVPMQEAMDPATVNIVGASRNSILLEISQVLILVLIAYGGPLKAMLPTRPIRFFLLSFAFAGILISGFRSLLFLNACYVILGAYIWGKGRALIAVAGLGIIGLLGVYTVNLITPLPLGMQRAMSFLPGDWDEDAKSDSEGSIEWRVEMWKEALFGHTLIENKALGDGFGFSAREMEVLDNARLGNNLDAGYQEHMMLVGGFHSGPISTIRFVGFFGLVLFSILIIVLSFQAWRCISRARGTPLFPLAIFFCLPLFWMPVFFFFIFGGFEGALPTAIYTAGVLQMLKNSLADYQENLGRVSDELPVSVEGGQVALARSSS